MTGKKDGFTRFLNVESHPETQVQARITSDAVHFESTYAHQNARIIRLILSVGVMSKNRLIQLEVPQMKILRSGSNQS
jgi:hypothetical protein